METQGKKRLPKSTKICIAIIVAMLIGAGIGTYFLYDYAYNWGHFDGYQKAYDIGYENGYNEGYSESENSHDDAQRENTGLGYLGSYDTPVYVTPSGEKYHESWCQYVQNNDNIRQYNNPGEALNAGYEPCSVCH